MAPALAMSAALLSGPWRDASMSPDGLHLSATWTGTLTGASASRGCVGGCDACDKFCTDWKPKAISCCTGLQCCCCATSAPDGAGCLAEECMSMNKKQCPSNHAATCIVSPSGIDLATCEKVCRAPVTFPPQPVPPASDKYLCEKAKCSPTLDGSGVDLAQCEKLCRVPPPPAPVPPPTPSGGRMRQKSCLNRKCTKGCISQGFRIGACVQVEGGGSMQVESCDPSGVREKFWSISTTCSGVLGRQITDPVDQCLQDQDGDWFENECVGGGVDAPLAGGKMRRAA